ncbi:MAG: DEAD/DEAH box helicase, partial [Rhodobacter sp.]|nr:DEAD/DEAH box helicase [Rhodobacter sp.]
MSRPERLFPLFADLETLDGVGPKSARALAGLGVERPKDLLFLLPASGVDRSRRASVRDVVPPVTLTVEVEVGAHFPPRTRGRPYRVMVRDAGLEFQLVYFHARGDFLQKLLPTGQRRLISGRIELFDGIAQMVHPDHVLRPEEAADLPAYEPVYPLVAGLTQKVMARAAASAVARAPDLPEWIDGPLKAREGWPDWRAAVALAHAPSGPGDLAQTAPARQRLAYDELFAHQLTLSLARASLRRGKGRASIGTGVLQARVLASLPYVPTGAQTRTLAEIAGDLASPLRMNRLLQGDVGSGKTLVAFLALLVAVEAGGQGVMMAPTEILARQHFAALEPLAAAAGVRLVLLTGRDKGAERAQKLAGLASGAVQVLVGTHSVFQKDVQFHDLRLAVVDEQHR